MTIEPRRRVPHGAASPDSTVKSNQRLEYGQLAKVMAERGMVEPQALQEALDVSTKGGVPFPAALVNANLVADWELSRVVCELYNLPFLTVDMCSPDPEAFEGIDEEYMRTTGLIPLSRFGDVLTLCMPGMVSAETLGMLAADLEITIQPVVGTVRSNTMWIESQFASTKPAPVEAGDLEVSAEWADIFDAADAAVLLDLEEDLTAGSEDGDESESTGTNMPQLGPALGTRKPNADADSDAE